MHNIPLGKAGEAAAATYLQDTLHYKILQQNYRNRFGEIDIIASDGKILVFVEVKTRKSAIYGQPAESVEKKKQKKITLTAMAYLSHHNYWHKVCRFDVIEVKPTISGFRIRHIRHAFRYAE